MTLFLCAWLCIGWSAAHDGVPKSADEAQKLREQIARDMQAVEKKLKAHDPGETTRDLQKRILANLDQLLQQAKTPPEDQQSDKHDPPGANSNPRAQSQPGTQRQPGREQLRRERRMAQRQSSPTRRVGSQPVPGVTTSSQPSVPSGDRIPPTGTNSMKAPAGSFGEVVKDIWGHLPDTLRQEVDHYYREQFMPRYRDLLQQYYMRLAETERGQKK
jgi:hypothetical protein